ncbi:hypothetical protein ACFL5O_08725 [Myxococcota bacterium]
MPLDVLGQRRVGIFRYPGLSGRADMTAAYRFFEAELGKKKVVSIRPSPAEVEPDTRQPRNLKRVSGFW